jgi:hypothetical protein
MPGFGALGTQWWMPVLFIVIAGHLTNVAVTLFLHVSRRIVVSSFMHSCRCRCVCGSG